MTDFLPTDITGQVSRALEVINHHLAATLESVHLFGSALDGGLRPHSDIDLLVTVNAPLDESFRQALLLDLLTVSAPPDSGRPWRPLEVTVIVKGEVVPWRYPARRELQFGEWLRQNLLAGIFEPPTSDHDLAILLTKARQHSAPLLGPPASTLFEQVPKEDFARALSHALTLWNSEKDWTGDERNVVLTLSRIWYSASTGRIAPKDIAAAWVLERLPARHQAVLRDAQAAYLGEKNDHLADRPEQTSAFIRYTKSIIEKIFSK